VVPRGEPHAVGVSALTGEGLDRLRLELAAVLTELWVDVDLAVPYTAGALLARLRERGSVAFDYRDGDVRIHGRVAPSLAGELAEAARSWRRALKDSTTGDSDRQGTTEQGA
jgi:GTPase